MTAATVQHKQHIYHPPPDTSALYAIPPSVFDKERNDNYSIQPILWQWKTLMEYFHYFQILLLLTQRIEFFSIFRDCKCISATRCEHGPYHIIYHIIISYRTDTTHFMIKYTYNSTQISPLKNTDLCNNNLYVYSWDFASRECSSSSGGGDSIWLLL